AGRRAEPLRGIGVFVALAAERMGDLLDGLSRGARLLRLRQARLYQDSDDPAATYRLRQLSSVISACLGAGAAAAMVGMGPGQIVAGTGLGLVIGGTRQRGRLDHLIDDRRQRMSLESYTINHLLALR